MNRLQFAEQLEQILLLGAHCDDIEIGAGGTVLHLAEKYPNAQFHWVVFSSDQVRENEARAAAAEFLRGVKTSQIVVKDFRNGYFPYIGTAIKDYFEQLKRTIEPDLVLTHYRDDLHQDHRTLAELTWNTWRDHTIWEYEIPKYDGGLGSPNLFISIPRSQAEMKIDIITRSFISQHSKGWFSRDSLHAMMRLRGLECNAQSNLAEAFYCRKMLM